MSDDEFIMENGINKIINFLEKNSDIDYSFGVCIGLGYFGRIDWSLFVKNRKA